MSLTLKTVVHLQNGILFHYQINDIMKLANKWMEPEKVILSGAYDSYIFYMLFSCQKKISIRTKTVYGEIGTLMQASIQQVLNKYLLSKYICKSHVIYQ